MQTEWNLRARRFQHDGVRDLELSRFDELYPTQRGILTDWPAWRSLKASLPVFQRLSYTFTTSAQYHCEPWPSWPRDIQVPCRVILTS